MTIDEAILHAEEVAKGYEEDISKWEYTLSEYRKRECVEQTTIPKCEKALNKCKQCASEHRQLAEWLKDYKRLKEQEPKWIPVSKRLPKEDDYKPFSYYEDGAVLFCTKNGKIGFGWYYNSTKEWANEDDKGEDVIAWQPLPKPYKGE